VLGSGVSGFSSCGTLYWQAVPRHSATHPGFPVGVTVAAHAKMVAMLSSIVSALSPECTTGQRY
jgi:hypothetical protein